MADQVPKALARCGLARVTDNLPPGVEVARFERDFALIFREELVAKFITGPAAPASRPEARLGRARAAGGAGAGLGGAKA